MVRINNLTKVYRIHERRVVALASIDLEVAQGEFVAVMGPSGSGKTTLLNIIGGLDRDYSGKVEVDGKDLGSLDDRAISLMRNRTLGFVFQAFHLLPNMTVAENVALPLLFNPGWSKEGARKMALEALARVGLEEKADFNPTRLSAGERQRVAIARAILNRPRLLLCDEPTGNLDAATGERVLDTFDQINREDGTTLIVATHSDLVARRATRTIILSCGRLVSSLQKEDLDS